MVVVMAEPSSNVSFCEMLVGVVVSYGFGGPATRRVDDDGLTITAIANFTHGGNSQNHPKHCHLLTFHEMTADDG